MTYSVVLCATHEEPISTIACRSLDFNKISRRCISPRSPVKVVVCDQKRSQVTLYIMVDNIGSLRATPVGYVGVFRMTAHFASNGTLPVLQGKSR